GPTRSRGRGAASDPDRGARGRRRPPVAPKQDRGADITRDTPPRTRIPTMSSGRDYGRPGGRTAAARRAGAAAVWHYSWRGEAGGVVEGSRCGLPARRGSLACRVVRRYQDRPEGRLPGPPRVLDRRALPARRAGREAARRGQPRRLGARQGLPARPREGLAVPPLHAPASRGGVVTDRRNRARL